MFFTSLGLITFSFPLELPSGISFHKFPIYSHIGNRVPAEIWHGKLWNGKSQLKVFTLKARTTVCNQSYKQFFSFIKPSWILRSCLRFSFFLSIFLFLRARKNWLLLSFIHKWVWVCCKVGYWLLQTIVLHIKLIITRQWNAFSDNFSYFSFPLQIYLLF